jgi:hypothetical protein
MKQQIDKINSLSHLTPTPPLRGQGIRGASPAWLIGRRIALGYTLNAGIALRSHSLQFKFEGELLNKAKKGKQSHKQKFSAANLLFECDGISKSQALTGRLSNLVCSFLVPLLQSHLIEVQGHIAYDIGPLGTFQDLPLSLQIIVRSEFFQLRRHGEQDSTESSDAETINSVSGSGSSSVVRSDHLHCIQAANDLLLWLAEGEAALITSRSAEKERKLKESENLSSSAEGGEEEGGDTSSITTSVDENAFEDLVSSTEGTFLSFTSLPHSTHPLRQPASMDGRVEMKRFRISDSCLVSLPLFSSRGINCSLSNG